MGSGVLLNAGGVPPLAKCWIVPHLAKCTTGVHISTARHLVSTVYFQKWARRTSPCALGVPCQGIQNLLQGSEGHSALGVHHPSQGIASLEGAGCQMTDESLVDLALPGRKKGKHFHGHGISPTDPRESEGLLLRAQLDPSSQEELPQEQVPT